MTQVFKNDGTVVPVTRVQAGPCVVTQVKTTDNHAKAAIQIGYGEQKSFRLNKAEQGHLKGLSTVRFLRDVATTDEGLKRGDQFTVAIFEPGEKVQVTGTSKGKGFQGVVKRHGFGGSPKTHGHKDQLRMPGSIGATDPGRVFKGTRMGGHMGTDRVTVKNLEIIEVLSETNELLIKGAIPGSRGNLLLISTNNGTIEIQEPVVEETTEETVDSAEKQTSEETSVKEESTDNAQEEQTSEAEAEKN